tara:strand:- start:729 stop:917 length:189 start_codon:yes stop_codon:yes gene_type:complete
MKTKTLDDEFFIRNAILGWMYHYPNHQYTPFYEEILSRDNIIDKPKPRPARRRKSSQSPGTQ